MKIFKIVCALIFAFLFCLSSSIFFKSQFQIEGDYLSAFSTLVAATFAYYFYSDWKDEHKFKLLDQYHTYLKEESSTLFSLYMDISQKLVSADLLKFDEAISNFRKNPDETKQFSSELRKICRVLSEYENFLLTLDNNEAIKKHRAKIAKFSISLRNIQKECLLSIPLYILDEVSSSQFLEIVERWRDGIIEFDVYCSIELSDFYFNYLKKNDLRRLKRLF